MKNKIIYLAASFSYIFPKWITSIPYLFLYFIAKIIFYISGFQTTPRNSLVDRCIVWGVSDIDFNVIVPRAFSKRRLWYFQFIYHVTKTIIPVLGEYNIIYKNNYQSFIVYGNYFVIRRDKLLSNFQSNVSPSEEDKIVFIVHALNSNRNHLTHFANLGKRKWNNYFTQTGISFTGSITTQSIIKALRSNFKEVFTLQMASYLEELKSFNDAEINCLYKSRNYATEMMILTPAIWLGPAFSSQEYERDIKNLLEIGEVALNLFLVGIKWEIWGLYTQYQLQNQQQLYTHLDNILLVLRLISDRISNDKIADIIDGIIKLKKLSQNERDSKNC